MLNNPWDIPAPNADDPAPRIIQLAAARPQGRDRLPPDPASFVEPVALARAMRDEPTRRAIEARLNGAARHVTVPPIRPTTAERIMARRRAFFAALAVNLLTWGVIGGCFVLIASGRL
jgi:hypothetical protein